VVVFISEVIDDAQAKAIEKKVRDKYPGKTFKVKKKGL
jgi:hypothetical protein